MRLQRERATTDATMQAQNDPPGWQRIASAQRLRLVCRFWPDHGLAVARKKIWWKIRANLEAPGAKPKDPCMFLGYPQTFQHAGTKRSLVDFKLRKLQLSCAF